MRQQVGAALFATVCDFLAPLQARRYLAVSLVVGTLEPTLFFNQNNLHARFAPRSIPHGDTP
ncbi:5-carboxymethyl-2-hydroxymuconate Delta-isomerase [compost metagenome]